MNAFVEDADIKTKCACIVYFYDFANDEAAILMSHIWQHTCSCDAFKMTIRKQEAMDLSAINFTMKNIIGLKTLCSEKQTAHLLNFNMEHKHTHINTYTLTYNHCNCVMIILDDGD